MKKLITLMTFIVSLSFSLSAKEILILTVTGGLADVHSHSTFDAMEEELSEYAIAIGADVSFDRFHNPKWKVKCEEVSELSKKKDLAIMTVGHSYGASAAILLAHCLQDKGINVDTMLQIDTIPKLEAKIKQEYVPENVKYVFNYYQLGDLLLRGNGNLRRVRSYVEDGKKKHKIHQDQSNIFNIKIHGLGTGFGLGAHTIIDERTQAFNTAVMKYFFRHNGTLKGFDMDFSLLKDISKKRRGELKEAGLKLRSIHHKKLLDLARTIID